ncbi:hypothetical protein PSQ39_17445 [Curvibacter sp. HBC28]|uniref:DNA binding HTH domain-containing protein n=1 Tax=Curvibacter microcysteis TaxID=3026419 RepID=A0ABT5MIL6_9BURK|nr:hypothetical protein [Curvibacter sp. HBC28]MDD0816428.1 hypothetical protein [Curvibacter sp. HBC28]
MSRKVVGPPSSTPGGQERIKLVEQILIRKFPLMKIHQALSSVLKPQADTPATAQEQTWEAERQRLLTLPEQEWQAACADHKKQVQLAQISQEQQRKAQAAAKAAKQEASRFYNRPSATPDYDFWSMMEYWTFDEAIALLLSKSPKVLTPAAVKKDRAAETAQLLLPALLPRSAFLDRYEEVYELARRAAAMSQPRLRPIAVIQWAEESGVIQPPSELELRVRIRNHKAQHAPASTQSPSAQAPTPTISTGEKTPKGQTKFWTAEKLAELAAYHARQGTKKAAEHFGISDGLVRSKLRELKSSAAGTKHKAGQAKAPSSVFDLAKR